MGYDIKAYVVQSDMPFYQGTLHVLAGVQYIGRRTSTVTADGKTRNYYKIALLFCRRTKKDRELIIRPRIMSISTTTATTEFNKFHRAAFGDIYITKKNEYLDFDRLGNAIVYELNAQMQQGPINFRVLWGRSKNYSPIEKIARLKNPLEEKDPEMVWPDYLRKNYPELFQNA